MSGDFRAGDVLVFHAFTVHSALDNQTDSMRLSVDCRWQSARHAIVDTAVPPHYFPNMSWAELGAGWSSLAWGELPAGVRTTPFRRFGSDDPVEPSELVGLA